MTDRLPVHRPGGEPAARRYLAERTRDLLREEAPPADPEVRGSLEPAQHPNCMVVADLGRLDRGQVLTLVREARPGAVATGEHVCEHQGFRYEVHRNPDTHVVPYAWNILVIPLSPEAAAAGFQRSLALYEWFEGRGIAASPAVVREG